MREVGSRVRQIACRGQRFQIKLVINDPALPMMVIFPGGPGFSYYSYEKQVMPFAEHVNFLFFDPRYCGNNPQPSAEHDYHDCRIQDYIDDVDAIVTELEINSFIVYASSFGSMAALGYASQHPDKVSAMILNTGAASYHFFELAKQELARRGTSEQQAICEAALWPGIFTPESFAEYMKLTAPLYSYAVAKTVAASAKDSSSASPYDSKQCNLGVLNRALKTEYDHFDWREDLAKIECPVMINGGAHDWINPPACAEAIANGIGANAELHIFKEASHAITADCPEEWQTQVLDFMQRHCCCHASKLQCRK